MVRLINLNLNLKHQNKPDAERNTIMKNLKEIQQISNLTDKDVLTKLMAGIKINELCNKLPGYKVTFETETLPQPVKPALPQCYQNRSEYEAYYKANYIYTMAAQWHIITLTHDYGKYQWKLPEIANFTNLYFLKLGLTVQTESLPETTAFLTLNIDALHAINQGIPYVGKDDLRPAMKGILIEVLNGLTCNLCATDAHRLLFNALPLTCGSNLSNTKLILPIELCKLLAKEKKPAYIKIHGTKQVSFNGRLFNLIDANFPDYKCIIHNYEGTMTVDKDGLLTAINQVLPCANKTTHLVRTTFNGCIQLITEDIDFGLQGETKIPYTNQNVPEHTIGFNGKFLTDVIKSFKDKALQIRSCGLPNKPIIIEDSGTLKAILMPIGII